MAYIFETDPRFIKQGQPLGEGEYGPSTVVAPGFEEIWQELARQSGIEPIIGGLEGEGENIEFRTHLNPAYTQWKEAKKAEGFDIGMEDIPGVKYKKNFTILKDGQPVSEPIKLETGQGFFSSISSAVKELAPVLLPALTGGLAGPLAGALGVSTPVASGLISAGVTALGGGDIGDIAKNALLSGAGSYASQTLQGATGGLSADLTPEMQATISSNPQGAFLGESAIPYAVSPQPSISVADLGAAAPVVGSAGDMMTGVDMSGNIINSLTGEVLVPATTAPINALTSAATQPTTQPSVQPAVAEAATTPPVDTTAGLSSADRAALYGDAGYGAGMTGAQTSAFDTTLGLTGSTALAAGAADVAGAAGTAGNLLGEALDFVTSPGGTALVNAVGSTVGGIAAGEEAKDAARLQSEAAANQLALQREMFEYQKSLLDPYYQAGKSALNRLTGAMGLGGQQQMLEMDLGYGFRLSEGMKALERQQAARGNLLSGGALKAGQRYAQDLASQEYGSAYNRLANLAGLGQTTGTQLGSAGQQFGTSAGGTMQDIAAYQGAGNLGRTSSYMSGLQGGLNALQGYANQQQQNLLMNQLLSKLGG